MPAVANKPFETNYRIPTSTGYVVLNGDQITKIEAVKVLDALGMHQGNWRVIFVYPTEASRKLLTAAGRKTLCAKYLSLIHE